MRALFRAILLSGLGLALASGCASKGGGSAAKPAEAADASCEGIRRFFEGDLDRYRQAVDEANKNYQEEQWRVETAAAGASSEKMSELFVVVQKVSYDKDILLKTRSLDDATKALTPKTCPIKEKLTRARGMLEASILTNDAVIQKEKTNQDLQDALEKKNNEFRLSVPGDAEAMSEPLFKKKLGSLADRKQREALYQKFNSARATQWLAWGFKDLIKAHNEEARLAGYPNYYEYRFFRNQLDLKNYRSMVEELKKSLAPKLKKVVSRWGSQAGIHKVEGWDLRYLREKASAGELNHLLKDLPESSVFDMAKRFYSALGISIDDYHFLMDLFPRAGKNAHAFAMAVVVPRVDTTGKLLPTPKPDIRFLANLKRPVQWDDISTVIHELAHAVHSAEIRQPLTIFRDTGSVETEAVAMLTERMADSQDYLADNLPDFTKVPAGKLSPILKRQIKGARIEQAFVLLRQVFFSDFEYELYKNPEANYGELWAKMHKDYFGVALDPTTADWDVEHYVMAPVYVQNYAIGILMVEQLYGSLIQEYKTSYRSHPLGDKLKKVYFAPGDEFNYLDLVQRFTGRPLTATAALKLLD